ncbi:PEP/pyruvate-binding domain-containing protein [Halococcoides cellulosivorans]|uniref:Phosphoenolpyruvate synthase n=1 Tax=Halococcoides cellulosivorans TaxID=1679096 RepID=A0A2R4X1W9_9EURY|nr:PEP/pyruvate-binding domain-containing protein [Halococcoides cellulosivorans]AWB27723.1 phosphoenolpyruvate synthase [Halococcoides cellulosivorans]
MTGDRTDQYVVALSDPSATDRSITGGKGANLARMQTDLPVPEGICVTAAASRILLDDPDVREAIDRLEADRDGVDGNRAGETSDPNGGETNGGSDTVGESTASKTSEIAAEIRDRIDAQPFPDGLEETLEARLDPRATYAVRSSATAEDRADASFAGQYDTILDVGASGVPDAVRDCVASLFADRAVHYREENDVPHAAVSMAVVVQRQVDADAAGVLFTADPTTGRRTVAAIDAAPGSGEAVVSGTIATDEIRVDRTTGQIEYTVGDREGPTEHTLTDEEVRTLVAFGDEIEALFGSPQDIEWAVADGTVWILQARPITTLFPVPAQGIDDGLHVYYSFNHRQGMDAAMPPLVADYWRRGIENNARRVGYSPSGPICTPAGGIVYMDATPLLGSDRLAGRFFGVLEEADREAIAPLNDVRERRGEEFADGSVLGGLSAIRTLSTLVGFAGTAARFLGTVVGDLLDDSPAEFPARTREWGDSVAERLIEDVRTGETDRERVRLALEAYEEFTYEVPGQAFRIWSSYLYRGALERLCPDADAAFEALERGLRDNVTTAMMLELGDAADVARGHPAVERAILEECDLATVRDRPGGEAFAAAFEEVLDRYGFRAAGEIDFSQPRYRDDPAGLLATIRASLETGSEGDHRERIRRLEREADDAIDRLESVAGQGLLGSIRRRLVRPLAVRYRATIATRELPKYALSKLLAETRDQVLSAGDALGDAGVLDDRDEVWLLEIDELLAALDGEPIGVDLADRRAEYRRWQDLRAPRVITSDGEMVKASGPADPEADRLEGTPTSGGVVEGRARIVTDPETADLAAGEILVAPHTDPGWTPLFLNAAGLVCDVGGRMSHGSMVAREYGIPAVVVPGGTDAIETGERIRVDGTRGVVERLE